MKRLFTISLLFFVGTTALKAQTVSLVKNINASLNNYGSNPQYLVTSGSTVIFSAYDPLNGQELWSSNGSTTAILKDIYPGGNGSYPSGMFKSGSYVYFQADDGVNGSELWRTDGTTGGTVLVKDINPGPDSSYPANFVQFNNPSAGLVYFTASEASTGNELWKTDGTTTTLVADIYAGSNDSYPSNLVAVGTSFLAFSAYNPTTGQEFYSYNGSGSPGVADIYSGTNGSYPSYIVSNGTKAFFQAYNATYGYELWISDGTTTITSGTGLGTYVVDIYAGASSSSPSYLAAAGTTVFFSAASATTGTELWKSTGGLTASVIDIVAGTGSSSPYYMTASGTAIFFVAYDAINGYTLKYITTAAATATAITGTISNIDNMLSYGSSQIFFRMYNGTYGYELWKANSTTATLVKDIIVGANGSYPSYFAFTGSDLYFSADDGVNGSELWKSDGTTPNTNMVTNINTAADSNVEVTNSTSTGFLLSAYDGVNGKELWKTDVTTAGTTLVADIATGTDYSNPTFLGQIGSNYFFSAYRSDVGTELWKTNGTSGATLVEIAAGTTSSSPYYGVVLNSKLYFYAYRADVGYELWVYDGTNPPTYVKDINPGINSSYPYNLTVMGTNIYFQADDGTNGYELWKSDGTLAGTSMVKNINLSSSSSPARLTAVGSTLYFVANDGVNGTELWKSDGTNGNTISVKDINPTGSSNPNYLTAIGSTLFFSANDGTNGVELWKSDGSQAGTVMVKDIESTTAAASSSPRYLTAGGPTSNILFFSAYTATNGFELWKSDGTTGGTAIVKDVRPGVPSASPFNITSINGTIYFYGTDGASGNLLYKTNGTSAGTIKATSSGLAYDSPGKPYYYNSKILFTGNTSFGNEPLSIMSEPLNQPTSLNFTGRTASSISGSFVAAGGSPTGYIVLRRAGSAPTDIPVDGSAYSVGASIGLSTVASIGSGTTFTDNSLSAATTYYYAVYSYNNDGVANIYRPWLPLQGNSFTLAADPTAQATALSSTNLNVNSFTVSFSAATGSPAGYLVLRVQGSTAPTDLPVDGTTYAAGSSFGSSTVVYVGSATSFDESALVAATPYSYAIFSYNGSSTNTNYLTTAPLTGTVTTLTAEPTAQATGLVFSNVQSQSLTVSFTAATGSPTGYMILRKQGSAPTAVPADGTVYTVGNPFGDADVMFVGGGTTFNDSGLTPGATYYYQVYAFNGTLTTINWLSTSPLAGSQLLFAADPVGQPTTLTFTNVTTNSFTVGFTAPATAPTGYLAIRRTGGSPTGIPVDGTAYTVGSTLGDGTVAYVGAAPSFNETLTLAAFNYDIYSYNGSAGATNYLTSPGPLEGSITPDTSAPVITNETLASMNSGGSLDIIASIVENESQITTVTVEYKSVSSNAAVTSQALTLTSGKWKFTIPAIQIGELGIEYKIIATNSQSLSSTVSAKTTLSFSDATVAFSTFGTSQSSFRIISVPLDLTSKTVNDVFADDLGAYDKAKWRMFRYENPRSPQAGTVELTGTSQIELGKGYWLIVKDSKTIDTGGGKTASATSTDPFTINLVNGWNQIGNPYNFNVVWADVLAASGLSNKLRTYGASGFVDGTKLNVFEGGFVFSNGAATLKFPVIKNASGRVAEASPKNLNALDQSDWEINFSLSNGDVANEFGGVGMSTEAKNDFDKFDDFTLPRFMNYIELNHDKKLSGAAYTKDVVPTSENHIWEFAIESNLEGITNINWDNSYFGQNDKNIYLYDVDSKTAVDMKESNSYAFESSTSRRFKVVYGSDSFVKDNALPEGLVINKVFPNPSDGAVTIGITVPNSASGLSTAVRVSTLLGQPLADVFDGTLPPGYHEIRWMGVDKQGQRPQQGLYLVEVATGNVTKVKRVVLK